MKRAPLARLALSLAFLAAQACAAQQPGVETLDSKAQAQRVNLYFIVPGDGGASGRKVGCGDSVVPAPVLLDRRQPALEGAFKALLGHRSRYDRPSGLYNALYASRLELDHIDHKGAEVTLYLTGYLELATPCDGPRLQAQLVETALQFRDVQLVHVLLGGKQLSALLRGVRGGG